MRIHILSAAVLLLPAVAAAQATSSAHAGMTAAADAHASTSIPGSFSTAGRMQLEATYARARQDQVPEAAIASRVDEGEAKHASEHAVLASAAKVEANMKTARGAMVAAGRRPTDAEIQAGAYAMERGVTKAQIGAMARRTPRDRSLAVAFDAVTELNANGVHLTNALSEVQAKLDAHASDAAIASLVTQSKAGIKIGG